MFVYVEEGDGILRAGRNVSSRGLCVHVSVGMVNMHARHSRAQVTRKFGGVEMCFFVV